MTESFQTDSTFFLDKSLSFDNKFFECSTKSHFTWMEIRHTVSRFLGNGEKVYVNLKKWSIN